MKIFHLLIIAFLLVSMYGCASAKREEEMCLPWKWDYNYCQAKKAQRWTNEWRYENPLINGMPRSF